MYLQKLVFVEDAGNLSFAHVLENSGTESSIEILGRSYMRKISMERTLSSKLF
jgi:hypothetical protein